MAEHDSRTASDVTRNADGWMAFHAATARESPLPIREDMESKLAIQECIEWTLGNPPSRLKTGFRGQRTNIIPHAVSP